MKKPDYVAIKLPGEDFYTWYDRNTLAVLKNPGILATFVGERSYEVIFTPSGKLIMREDGELAEIFEIADSK